MDQRSDGRITLLFGHQTQRRVSPMPIDEAEHAAL